MLHRYRVAMVRPGRERLAGHVEVDEAYVGGVEGSAQGRKTETKAIVAIAVEIENPKGFGRIRLKHVPDVTAESLLPFIDEAVEPGASVHTDGWQAYWKLPERGYEHERTVMRQQSEPAYVVMPGVHRVASLLQRWLLGTHQGRASREHLDAYLNEFTFRFNRRNSRRRGLLFYRLLEQSIAADPITYHSLLVNPTPTGRRSPLPSSPGRVATVPTVNRPWRQNAATTGLPD
jgi:transposase-like protein